MAKLSRGRVGVKITLGSVQKWTVRFLPQNSLDAKGRSEKEMLSLQLHDQNWK